ncbi:hypothetical protein GCM10011428_78700 [Streptomyces violaceus]
MGETLSDQDRGRIGILRASSTSSGSLAGGSVSRLNSRRRSEARNSAVKYSSGRRSTHRLNYGGDRQANAAPHRIVFTRLRFDPRAQACYERRTQGKTRREIIRCLKRYAACEVFNLVRTVPSVPPL